MNDFIIIDSWMVEKLKLTGNRLIVYAVIYRFSKDGGWFQGTAAYLGHKSGLSERGIRKILKSLCAEGLLMKKERFDKGKSYVDYKAIYTGTTFTPEQRSPRNNVPFTPEQRSGGGVNNVPTKVNIESKKKVNSARARTRKRDYKDFPQREETDYDYIEEMLHNVLPVDKGRV